MWGETERVASAHVTYTSGQDEVNAKLIAAAPELLSSLVQLVQQVEDGPFFHEEEHTKDCPINLARAAIAKATK